MTRDVRISNQFRKDLKRVKKQGKSIDKLDAALELLKNDFPLPPKLYDHNLTGNWHDHRELHIEPDWILIYQKLDDNNLYLVRTGSHADLF